MTAPMTPLLQQFLSESRDFLEGIGEKLIQLENAPGDTALMSELFRLVHTLKGNCGLFDFPEMSRVLHAAEDLMAVVRDGELGFSQALADCLLEAMDFVSMLLDEIEANGSTGASHATVSAKLAEALRQLISPAAGAAAETGAARSDFSLAGDMTAVLPLADVPEATRMAWYRQARGTSSLLWVAYRPEAECFFKGEDPFFQAIQVPGVIWRRVTVSEPWPALAALDAYRCVLDFQMISTAPCAEIEEHFRYASR